MELEKACARALQDSVSYYLLALQAQKQITSQAETLANFGLAAGQRGDYSQAISQLQDAVQECGNCPSRPDIYKDLGLIECRAGDVRSGEKDLLMAKQLKGEDADVGKALEVIRGMKGK
jgi:Tfp pilus assembly protein PilF